MLFNSLIYTRFCPRLWYYHCEEKEREANKQNFGPLKAYFVAGEKHTRKYKCVASG